MNAPRALPIVSGPVGLADTNSTLTFRGRIGRTRPQRVGPARTPCDRRPRARDRPARRLMKPGAATSADAIGLSPAPSALRGRSPSASTRAISSGDRRYGRASLIARFDAKSPCSGLAGRSMSTAGRSSSATAAASAPAAIARSQARSTAARACVRIGGGGLGERSSRGGGLIGVVEAPDGRPW